MHISVRGKNDKLSKSEVRQMVDWYASKLLTKKRKDKLKVVVIFESLKDNKGLCGEVEDCFDNTKHYEIQIDNKMGKRKQMITLAHEMVHVKCFSTGEHKQTGTNSAVWRKTNINENKIDYWDLPWEIEAYGREMGLYYRYLDYLKLIKTNKRK